LEPDTAPPFQPSNHPEGAWLAPVAAIGSRQKMTPLHYQILRVTLGIALAILASMESSFWWLPAIPWAVLCAMGLLLTIPIVFVIGIGAGAAQADWMSDGFIIGLVIVTPTVLAVIVSAIANRRKARRPAEPKQNQAEQGVAPQPAARSESDFSPSLPPST
ncbi:hypothetical protein, partial [Haloferula sp. A504]|uniref:hypothetical protein n=1 Tax=Haloferula sp. A504 TaxID=3373601 RepID=UPI0031CAD73C|nr:hypothetical protein [Verrucomicrobiaceae bacterium E54]